MFFLYFSKKILQNSMKIIDIWSIFDEIWWENHEKIMKIRKNMKKTRRTFIRIYQTNTKPPVIVPCAKLPESKKILKKMQFTRHWSIEIQCFGGRKSMIFMVSLDFSLREPTCHLCHFTSNKRKLIFQTHF